MRRNVHLKNLLKMIVSTIVVIVAIMLLLTGCSFRAFEYTGDYPELWSAAVGSIPGLYGHGLHGRPRGDQPTISVLAEDDFGRILFQYEEFNPDFFVGYHVLIIQKVENGYIYFYPNYNFISKSDKLTTFLHNGNTVRRWKRVEISNNDMERFKEANSWNRDLSYSGELDRVKVVRHRERGPLSDEQLIEADRTFFPTATLGRTPNLAITFFLRTDNYGRSMYFRRLAGYDPSIVLFQPDFSFNSETGLFKITDLNDYQTELRLFMEANGWGTPLY